MKQLLLNICQGNEMCSAINNIEKPLRLQRGKGNRKLGPDKRAIHRSPKVL